jgi:hypothetical protein
MHELTGMTIVTKTSELLAILKKNRESHRLIVEEARVGYIEKAREALNKRLDALKAGKVVGLSFGLQLPVDQTSVYDTAIKMLELHQGDTIELSHTQVRNLVLDKWDWTGAFRATSVLYSETARSTFGSSDEDE